MQLTNRAYFLGIAAFAATLSIASILLTVWLQLQPCHLCIFQRLLFMLIAGVAAVAALSPRLIQRSAGAVISLGAAIGAWTAGYQSWLQAQPPGSVSCVGSELGPIEQLVEWLGQRMPSLFLATGFCEDEALVILGLSLVHWALLSFLAVLALALWLTFRGRPR
jgi:disulfide bond formation protein DsbB